MSPLFHGSLDDVAAIVVEPKPRGRDGKRQSTIVRWVRRREADDINAGKIAAPNLYCSLDAKARAILVRVFEKHCCHEQPTRSIMAPPNTK